LDWIFQKCWALCTTVSGYTHNEKSTLQRGNRRIFRFWKPSWKRSIVRPFDSSDFDFQTILSIIRGENRWSCTPVIVNRGHIECIDADYAVWFKSSLLCSIIYTDSICFFSRTTINMILQLPRQIVGIRVGKNKVITTNLCTNNVLSTTRVKCALASYRNDMYQHERFV